MQHVDVRAHLVGALQRDLIGPMEDAEVLSQEPSRWYLTGFLVPTGASDAQRYDPTALEETSAGLDGDGDDDGGDDGGPAARPFLPSSFGCSVLVSAGTTSLDVSVQWGEYLQISEEETRALRDADRAKRGVEIEVPEGEEEEKLRYRYWRRTGRSEGRVLPLVDGRYPVPDSKGLVLVVRQRPAVAPGLAFGTLAVSVFLVNDRVSADGPDEATVFQVEVGLRCAAGFVPRTHHEGTDHPDDRRNDLQYRDHREYAVGHGVSTVVDDATCVRTSWMPSARVFRMRTNDGAGVPLAMEALAELDGVSLRAAMAPLLVAYEEWIVGQAARGAGLSSDRATTAATLVEHAREALARIQGGLDHLAEDSQALQAFQLANRAMAMAASRVRPDKVPEWRLFQLAFLLLNVRPVAEPADADRRTVELLFFPTGGGKTEAYLGIAAYAMLLRRLRHAKDRHGGAGVTVILRYTLRLLTLDQLGRAATLTCALELLRREAPKVLGDRRFTVGLWVGRKATANTLDDAEKQLEALRHKRSRELPVPLVGCPWCQHELTTDAFDLEKEAKKPVALKVACPSAECPFSFAHGPGLPILVVDEQIYRELPSFLIATVDKFAALPWRGATGALFGRVSGVNARGFYGAHEEIPKDADFLARGVPPPSLILQDELHLITGPLGTMVGLYETAVDQLCSVDGCGPKIIASTATARRASEQVRALYAREKTGLFPPQGVDDGDTFFAETDRREEVSRLYLGVAAPGRSMKAVAVRVYSTLLSAAGHVWSKAPPGEKNPADTYMTLVNYFNSLRELGGAQRLVSEEVAPLARRMNRHRPVGQAESPWFGSRAVAFESLELTSRQETNAIRDAKGKLEGYYDPKEGRRTDVLLASSMISVGVDIPRLGLMVVNGQPRTVAEYIQASSRVGRSTPGLVVTLHNLHRPRDRSHYERFTAFHECFYRYVEAASVTPFSPRALERGLAGLTVALARHGRAGLADARGVEKVRKAIGVDAQVASVVGARALAHGEDVPDTLRADVEKRVIELVADWGDITADMAKSSAAMAYSNWEKAKGAATFLLLSPVDPPSTKHILLERFRAPTSMRDVEPSVHVWVRARSGTGAE